MEKIEPKQDDQQSSNLLFMILAYISWVAASVNSWVSLAWLYSKKHRTFWNIYIYLEDEAFLQRPIQMYYIMNYIVFNIAFATISIGCVVFFITTLFKKDQEVINGMMGKISRFHFFPFLCFLAMTIIGELGMDEGDIEAFYTTDKAGIAITLVGLASIIVIYLFTEIKSENWWANFFLKKGAFSCMIVLFWYDFCYDVFYLRIAVKKSDEDLDWMKGCGIFFSILFGLCNIVFSFAFKDIMISFLNTLIYIGMAIHYFNYSEGERSTKQYNKNGDGIVDIIILSFSIILLFYLIVEKITERDKEVKAQLAVIRNFQNQINNSSEMVNLVKVHNIPKSETLKLNNE